MAKQDINIGSGELTGDGESIRSALNKTNLNFTEVYNDIGVLQSTAFSGDYNDLNNLPTIPSAISELANDSGYLTTETDPIFTASPAAQIQQSNITNWNEAYNWGDHSQAGYLTSVNTFSGSYNDLTDTPTIPTNISELVNDSGYITTYTVTQADVTQYQQALSITESQISNLQSYLTTIVNENIEDLSNVDITGIGDGYFFVYNATSGNWETSATVTPDLTAFSVTAPNAASGSGGLDYNNTTGAFTYTPPDLSSYLTAEVDTLDSVVARDATTSTQVALNGGIITTGIESTNGVSSVYIAEGSALTIGSTAGVRIIGAASAAVDLGTETSGTVTIGSGSNTVDYPAGTTVDFTGATVTGTSFLTSETTTTLGINANILKYTDETGAETDIDLSLYLDDTNLARLTTGTLDSGTGIATFTRDDATTFTVDFSDLLNQSEVNDLTTSVTWANVPDANITQSSVTQHQAALSITESQISDLQSYLTAETNDLTAAVTWANVPDANITQSSVTQHQAALSITESQISDLQSYLTSFTETNDLTAAVTWANVPDANITQSSVTQHQAALSITESQISDLQSYLTAEVNDLTSAVTWANVPDANITQSSVTQHQAALSITESQISDLQSYLTAETNDLTAAVTWANVPDANITQSSVTQHQAALSITESQISDLQSYLTTETDPVFSASTSAGITDGTGFLKNDGAGNWSYDNSTYLTSETSHADVLVDGDFATAGFMKTDGAGNYTVDNSTYLTSFTEINDLTAAVTWANVPDANITQSSVTQHQAALSITESQISDLGSYLTDLTGSSVGTLSDVDFNSVTLDASNGQDKVLAWDQTAQAFVPVDQTNTNTTTFGIAGNTGTHTFDMTSETLTFLGTTNQIDIEVATNFISVGLASVVNADLKGSVFADDSSLIVNGVDGTLAYTATTPTDWNGTAPTTVGEAIDRLAALVKTLNGGTGA